MKVEIGESLVRTWIRHNRGCQLAELNWKPSPKWPGVITQEHKHWYEEASAEFSQKVLKKTSSISQFLGQAEIDVLGVRFIQGKADKVIAADVAFHTNGLQYGGKGETAARVAKKLLRTAILLDVHFPNVPAEIVFLSPKVNPSNTSGVIEAERMVQSFFDIRRSNLKIRSIINQDFRKAVLDSVMPLQKEIADTSELFLRAAQLIGLFQNDTTQYQREKTTAISMPKGNTGTLPIEFQPNDPDEFKRLLLKKGAVKYEHYYDGKVIEKAWPADNMTERSNILGNLRSSKGYRQGEWQAKGMIKLVVKIVGCREG